MSEIESYQKNIFESARQVSEQDTEYWSARILAKILDYSEFRKFINVIKKAKQACKNSQNNIKDHFANVIDIVKIGSGAERTLKDIRLSRYACYLIVQNADATKAIVAFGQTYFAVQTRRQEIADDIAFQRLQEDEKRIFLRKELKEHNKKLGETAKNAGIETTIDFAIFQNHGYKGLYGGLGAKDIYKKKKLKKNQQILDYMGSTELAANLFRATQAEEKLRRDKVKGKQNANKTHFEVGVKVRKTIKELGGMMPENLPTPESGIQVLEQGASKRLRR